MTVYKANNKTKFCLMTMHPTEQTHVGTVTFTGAGLNDCTVTVPTGFNATIPNDFTLNITVAANGTPDTVDIVLGSTPWLSGVSMAATVNLPYGLQAQFAATTGHTIGNKWAFPIYAFASHQPQTLASGYTKHIRAALPSYNPVGVDVQDNKNTGSSHPKDVSISGVRVTIPIEIDDANVYDVWNWLQMVYSRNFTLAVDDDDLADLRVYPDYDLYNMPTRCVGFREGKNMAYHRIYGTAPGPTTFTFPTTEGGKVRIGTTLNGIGKYDIYPGAPEEIVGTLGDTTLTVGSNPKGYGSVAVLNSIRQVWAINSATTPPTIYSVVVNGCATPYTTTIQITPPVAASSDACTYYVVYLKDSDIGSSATSWAYNLENAQEPDDVYYQPIKSTHLQGFFVGGTVTGTAGSTETLTTGKRIRCDLEGDIQMTVDPRQIIKVCSDGTSDNAANLILTDGPMFSISFSQLVYDQFYRYISENTAYALAGFPVMFSYYTNSIYLTFLIPKCKLTSANAQDMNGRVGVSLQPVILDDGTYSPCIVVFNTPG